jgi:hypothetical protein
MVHPQGDAVSQQRRARKTVERNEAEIARWVARGVAADRAKHPNAQSLALLHRRIGRQADPAGAADLGAQGQDTGAVPPVPAWQTAVDVRAGGLPARTRTTRRSRRPGWALICWRAPTTPASASGCWMGLGSQLGHQPVTVIWDNLGAHHAGDLQAWAATQSWLVVEYLPSYAPELDPVEGLWATRRAASWPTAAAPTAPS